MTPLFKLLKRQTSSLFFVGISAMPRDASNDQIFDGRVATVTKAVQDVFRTEKRRVRSDDISLIADRHLGGPFQKEHDLLPLMCVRRMGALSGINDRQVHLQLSGATGALVHIGHGIAPIMLPLSALVPFDDIGIAHLGHLL